VKLLHLVQVTSLLFVLHARLITLLAQQDHALMNVLLTRNTSLELVVLAVQQMNTRIKMVIANCVMMPYLAVILADLTNNMTMCTAIPVLTRHQIAELQSILGIMNVKTIL